MLDFLVEAHALSFVVLVLLAFSLIFEVKSVGFLDFFLSCFFWWTRFSLFRFS